MNSFWDPKILPSLAWIFLFCWWSKVARGLWKPSKTYPHAKTYPHGFLSVSSVPEISHKVKFTPNHWGRHPALKTDEFNEVFCQMVHHPSKKCECWTLWLVHCQQQMFKSICQAYKRAIFVIGVENQYIIHKQYSTVFQDITGHIFKLHLQGPE